MGAMASRRIATIQLISSKASHRGGVSLTDGYGNTTFDLSASSSSSS